MPTKTIRTAFVTQPEMKKALQAASKATRLPESEIIRAGVEAMLKHINKHGKLPSRV